MYKDAVHQEHVLNSLCPKAAGANRSKYFTCVTLRPPGLSLDHKVNTAVTSTC